MSCGLATRLQSIANIGCALGRPMGSEHNTRPFLDIFKRGFLEKEIFFVGSSPKAGVHNNRLAMAGCPRLLKRRTDNFARDSTVSV